MNQNRFERYAKFLADQGETLTQNTVAWSCGCSMALVAPKDHGPGFEMGMGYVVNPCEKHPKGWDAVPKQTG